jgi:tetratricopeptide (TPR) repeat protein
VLLAGWPLLLLARARRGFDPVEALLCLLFSALALRAQRFLGFYALVAAPYLARDLDEWLGARKWPSRAPHALRAALASLACVAAGLPEWVRPALPIGIGFAWASYPVAACDFMEAHGVRGRGFNQFGYSGYMLYRFWPDRTRLPFMDIHQSGTRLDRDQYAWAQSRADTWQELDQRYRFDYALLTRRFYERNLLLNLLDADSTWALVFLDDVMALYVRREGPLADVARGFAYREIPGGGNRLAPLGAACARDPQLRARTAAELERVVKDSPRHAQALILLANLALQEGRFADARRFLERALPVDPNRNGVHWRLAAVALEEGRPRDALAEVGRERKLSGPGAGLDVFAGRAWQALGDRGRAVTAYRKAVTRDSSGTEARDSLASMARGGGV